MVVLMDYSCPVCGADPEYQDECTSCKNGVVRLPTGTIPYRDTNVELMHRANKPIPDGPFAKVDVIDDKGVYVNGEKIEEFCSTFETARIVQQVLEAADCPHEIDTLSEYEATDTVDYLEDQHYDDPDDIA